jgi:hypothetical protein
MKGKQLAENTCLTSASKEKTGREREKKKEYLGAEQQLKAPQAVDRSL